MIERVHHQRKLQNILLFFIGIAFAIILSLYTPYANIIKSSGNFGYLIAYLAGLLFTSTFTVATGGLILLTLSHTLSPPILVLIAGSGAVTGDLLMFNFVKDNITTHVAPLYQKIIGSHFKKILHSRLFGWTLPVVGALIIASPLPDELGISLLGITKIRLSQFILISGASHLLGMFLVISPSFFT